MRNSVRAVHRFVVFVVLVILVGVTVPAFAAGKAEHIVVVVWDGMRPDMITESNCPTLFKLANDGVFFRNHHAVYLSSTEVNGTALATGCYPNRSGILANRDYRPELNPTNATAVEIPETVRAGDALSRGHYIGVPTLAEILRQAGQRTVIAGAKRVTLLHDRKPRPEAEDASVDLFEGKTLPVNIGPQLEKLFGPLAQPGTRRDEWTVRALTEMLWTKEVPRFSLLWLSEPDLSQHRVGPGHEAALAAIRGSDNNLARILETLTAKGIRDKTDVFVVSDHGFSTASRSIDLSAELTKAGFDARPSFNAAPTNGQIMVVGNGGSALIYVIGHGKETTRRLVEFLQQQDYVGVIMTQEALPGTFTLEQAHINVVQPPDLVVSMRWTDEKSASGTPGLIASIGTPPNRGYGTHGSLSRFDMHNTLIAAGPDFLPKFKDELPSGNADLAPTILHLLGVTPPEPMDGRVLTEALTGGGSSPRTTSKTLEAKCALEHEQWRQYLKTSSVGGAIYLDEGNGLQVTPK